MPDQKEKILNIPNALSAYRIVALPFIIYAIASGNRHLFIILISVNLITDILDGIIARTFNMQTEFGARLDSAADIGTFLMAVAGVVFLDGPFVHEHFTAFLVLMVCYLTPYVISLIKFGRLQSLHLYAYKITGYVQGIFIFTYFNFGYAAWYFYLMMVVSFWAYVEETASLLVMKELRSNIKSVFLLKRKDI